MAVRITMGPEDAARVILCWGGFGCRPSEGKSDVDPTPALGLVSTNPSQAPQLLSSPRLISNPVQPPKITSGFTGSSGAGALGYIPAVIDFAILGALLTKGIYDYYADNRIAVSTGNPFVGDPVSPPSPEHIHIPQVPYPEGTNILWDPLDTLEPDRQSFLADSSPLGSVVASDDSGKSSVPAVAAPPESSKKEEEISFPPYEEHVDTIVGGWSKKFNAGYSAAQMYVLVDFGLSLLEKYKSDELSAYLTVYFTWMAGIYLGRYEEGFKRLTSRMVGKIEAGDPPEKIADWLGAQLKGFLQEGTGLEQLRKLLDGKHLLSIRANFMVRQTIHNIRNDLAYLTAAQSFLRMDEGTATFFMGELLAAYREDTPSIRSMINRVRSKLRLLAAEHNIRIRMSGVDKWRFSLDESRLKLVGQVMENVVGNAVKYSRPNEERTLEGMQMPKEVMISFDPIRGVINIRDFGVGTYLTRRTYGVKEYQELRVAVPSEGTGSQSVRKMLLQDLGWDFNISSSLHRRGPTKLDRGTLFEIYVNPRDIYMTDF